MADPPPTYGVSENNAERHASSISEEEKDEGGELQSAYKHADVPLQTECEARIVADLPWSPKNVPLKVWFGLKRVVGSLWGWVGKATHSAHELRALHAAGICVPELLRRGYSLLQMKRNLKLTTVGALCKNGLGVDHVCNNALMWGVLLQHFGLLRHHLQKYFSLADFSDYLAAGLNAYQLEALGININGLLDDERANKEDLRRATFERHWDWKEWKVFGFDEDAARTLNMREEDYLACMHIHPQQMAMFLGILKDDTRSIQAQYELDLYDSIHSSEPHSTHSPHDGV